MVSEALGDFLSRSAGGLFDGFINASELLNSLRSTERLLNFNWPQKRWLGDSYMASKALLGNSWIVGGFINVGGLLNGLLWGTLGWLQ
jgi:hypothetical protein